MAERVRNFRAQYIMLAVFVVMLVSGLILGGFGKVVANGIVICLDCIGLI